MEKFQVASVNPIQFVKDIEAQIQNGFYVTPDLGGYPVLGCPLIIVLSELEEAPAVIAELEGDTITVEGWNILTFLLDVQNAVQQGYELDTYRAVFGDFKSMIFTKRPEVVLDLTPTPKAEEKAPAKTRKPRTPKGEQE